MLRRPLKKLNYPKRKSDLGSRLRGNDVVGGDGSSGRMAMIAEVSITIGLDSAAVFQSRAHLLSPRACPPRRRPGARGPTAPILRGRSTGGSTSLQAWLELHAL